MQRLRVAAARVAPHPTTVLLAGETGTGKGVLARAIHAASPRRGAPFVQVDCAGLAGPLLEAELYGVARGAYTGAHESRAGRFEAAGAGTLFLDEIAELPLSGQAKLLRALEEGTFERVGETRTRRLRARVIAATHVDLERAVSEGRFRADLYFRLRVVALVVPPLRARVEDLEAWIERAAERAAERLDRPAPGFDPEAIARLVAHGWPGNLRELFHLVEAAAIWAEGPVVDAALVERLLPSPAPLEPELARARGNLSLAARRLGIPRSTLRARIGRDDPAHRMRRLRRGRRAGRDAGGTGEVGGPGEAGDMGDAGDAGNVGEAGDTGGEGDAGEAGGAGDAGRPPGSAGGEARREGEGREAAPHQAQGDEGQRAPVELGEA
jgi:DNA-binding NtrC family response regulator